MTNKYNHAKREIELLQKITNITSLILTLYCEGKISEEVKNKLMEVISNEKIR